MVNGLVVLMDIINYRRLICINDAILIIGGADDPD